MESSGGAVAMVTTMIQIHFPIFHFGVRWLGGSYAGDWSTGLNRPVSCDQLFL